MLHIPPTNLILLAAKQESYKKKPISLRKILKNFLEKVQKKGPASRKRSDRMVTGLGRRTREEIAKWNQMTALRFQTGGRSRHPRPPCGAQLDMIILLAYYSFGLNVHSNLLQLIRDGGKWGGMGTYVLPPYRYTVTTRMTALRRAAAWAIFMFHWLCGQSHKTVSINHKFLRERGAEADRTEVLLLTSIAPYR